METWECPACLGWWPGEERTCPWCRWVQRVEKRTGKPLAVLMEEQPRVLAWTWELVARGPWTQQ